MKIVTVIGARPQFVKAAALSSALRPLMNEVIVHTGQHYDDNMSAIFFQQLKLQQPDYELGIGSGTHAKQTARMLEGIEDILVCEKPDMVLVYGDTNSTLAGSLAASKLHIPIAHVEAGLRSFNRQMPEEINRVLTDHLSALLFCPTHAAVANLEREGICNHIHLVGDVMFDSLLFYKELAMKESAIVETLKLTSGSYYLATIHRAENTKYPDQLKKLLETLGLLDHVVILPLHPRTKRLIADWKLEDYLAFPNLRVIEPLSYLDMIALENQAKLILTDSGGVQKEAYMLQVPCITIRNETEWIETVQVGWNHTTGFEPERIREAVFNLHVPAESPPIFGDGNAAGKISELIRSFLV